jgi:hypothetical protein
MAMTAAAAAAVSLNIIMSLQQVQVVEPIPTNTVLLHYSIEVKVAAVKGVSSSLI